jgi:spore maturation protein CgeB
MRAVLNDADLANALTGAGLETIMARHTCRHRVDELLIILGEHGTAPVKRQINSPEAAE